MLLMRELALEINLSAVTGLISTKRPWQYIIHSYSNILFYLFFDTHIFGYRKNVNVNDMVDVSFMPLLSMLVVVVHDTCTIFCTIINDNG